MWNTLFCALQVPSCVLIYFLSSKGSFVLMAYLVCRLPVQWPKTTMICLMEMMMII